MDFMEAGLASEPTGGNILRHFLVSGKLNGGDFSITLSTKKHVSVADVYRYLTEHGQPILEIRILNIYEFPDEADYSDYKKEEVWFYGLKSCIYW